IVVQSRMRGRFFKKYGWRRPAAISTGELSRKFSEPAAAYCADAAGVPSASTVPKQAQIARLSRLNEQTPLTRRQLASQPKARLPPRGKANLDAARYCGCGRYVPKDQMWPSGSRTVKSCDP